MKKLWEEFVNDLKPMDLTSFEMNDELNPKIWDRAMGLNPEVSAKLRDIVDDFLENIGLEGLEYEDITFTGSLANFNWSKYSDIDLHIVVDFSKIDENDDLVREFFRGKFGLWNKNHDIMIRGFEVEIYVQDSRESHVSTGVYSVLSDEWLAKPSKEVIEFEFDDIKKKASKLMSLVDSVKEVFYEENYEEAHERAIKIKEKIRKFRKCGLESGGQYSSENLAFKVLRRNGYLEQLSGITSNSYDRMMSMAENFNKKFNNFIKEEEKYQKMVKNKHSRLKKGNIGLGDQENKPPYTKKPNFKRSKSAPPHG